MLKFVDNTCLCRNKSEFPFFWNPSLSNCPKEFGWRQEVWNKNWSDDHRRVWLAVPVWAPLPQSRIQGKGSLPMLLIGTLVSLLNVTMATRVLSSLTTTWWRSTSYARRLATRWKLSGPMATVLKSTDGLVSLDTPLGDAIKWAGTGPGAEWLFWNFETLVS